MYFLGACRPCSIATKHCPSRNRRFSSQLTSPSQIEIWLLGLGFRGSESLWRREQFDVFFSWKDVLANGRIVYGFRRKFGLLLAIRILMCFLNLRILVFQVEAILDKDGFTLEELLDEDEIIQECKSLNGRLLNLYALLPKMI